MNRLHRWYCRSNHWARTVETTLPWTLGQAQFGDEVLEIGPGPGKSTDWLRRQCRHLTCLEIDAKLARSLSERVAGLNVSVLCGDATRMPFEAHSFSNVVCFTMLHHIPSVELQDRLFAEVYRVLKPGGMFAGADNVQSPWMSLFHCFDTMVLVDPVRLPSRLESVGFADIAVETARERFRFMARRLP